MPKQNQPVVNFNKGLITEANPLTQPLGSTRGESNFRLNNDGTRQRRLGLDLEVGGVEMPTTAGTDTVRAGVRTFTWDLTGEEAGLYILCVQIANVIRFYKLEDGAVSTKQIGSITVQTITDDPFSVTQVDNTLVIATGKELLSVHQTNSNGSFSFIQREIVLEIRDFFGLEDYDHDVGGHIDRGNLVKHRPPRKDYQSPDPNPNPDPAGPRPRNFTKEHYYNLINQGWAEGKVWSQYRSGADKIERSALDASAYAEVPSNADIYDQYVIAITDKNPKEIKTFSSPLFKNEVESLPTSLAPRGKTIIELLSRGKGRFTVASADARVLPKDITPSSASVVAEYSGRVFYAGFSGAVVDGDDRSPNLNNYVMFSQLVTYKGQASQCFQVSDPTDPDDSELVDTDGGYIRISEATNIVGLESVGNSLLVFAENGVWQILGTDSFGFTATGYQVVKISERGCLSTTSIVNVAESVMYWAQDGIYLLAASESGFFVAQDITKASIKTHYENITEKTEAYGVYDDFEKAVKWVYGGSKELVLKIELQAWLLNDYKDSNLYTKAILETPPYIGGVVQEDVTVQGVAITSNNSVVTVQYGVKGIAKTETKYLVVDKNTNNFMFSEYNNQDFLDGGTSDAEAWMMGAHYTGGTGNRNKQSPYVTFHFNKTEDGFNQDFTVQHESSCLVRTTWDWANHLNSGKGGKEFQAYRFRRHYIPTDFLDGFDNGFETVVTKNKVRGRGKALSVNIRTEPLKDCHLIGWEQEISFEK